MTETKHYKQPGGRKKSAGTTRRSRSQHPHVPSVLVLAAGMSSRFGSTKQVAMLGGKTVVERVVDSIPEAKVREVVVVLGHDSAAVRKALGRTRKVRVVFNPEYASGMSTSISAGLRALAKDAGGVMIMLGDQPFVTRSLLEKLLRKYGSGGKIVGVSDGRVVTPPVIFPRAFFRELGELEGDQGARSVVQRHANMLSVVKTRRKASTDIDTEEDLRLARRRLI